MFIILFAVNVKNFNILNNNTLDVQSMNCGNICGSKLIKIYLKSQNN